MLLKACFYVICCVFRPANGCSACRSLVKINFLTLKQLFALFYTKKSISLESLFRPANGVLSTCSLVEIHNSYCLMNCSKLYIPSLNLLSSHCKVLYTLGIWNPNGQKQLVCKWSGFRIESDIWKPDHLKSGQMSAILSKTFEKHLVFQMVGRSL